MGAAARSGRLAGWLAAFIAAGAVTMSCALVGRYDFDGYQLAATPGGKDASVTDGACVSRTCEELGAEC
ncbi:MAG TPA: hypothetical protein VJT73_03035, partial [Polyangiaceae bacterium]|nr:hypothetical protein [Polyangiaceae bacterium]